VPHMPWTIERAHPVRVALVGLVAAAAVWGVLIQDEPDTMAQMSALAACVAALCSGVFLYIDWHIGLDRSTAWLVTALSAFGLQELLLFRILLADVRSGGVELAWIGVYQVLVCLGLCLLVTQARHLRVRHDPLALGVLLGLGIGLVRYGLTEAPLPEPSVAVHTATIVALALIGVWNAVSLLRSRSLQTWIRWRVALASCLLGLGQTAAFSESWPTWTTFASVFVNLAGAGILLTTAASRARYAVSDEVSAVNILRRRLESAEVDLHTHQAGRHEIRATLAGLASASHLLHRSGIGEERREQLEAMIDDELARLGRLVNDRSAATPEPVELDATLRHVVVRHEAAGMSVRWQPSGHVARARADDVAEIVGVLLSNAARHASGSMVTLEVSEVASRIEISLSDSGPGVDPRLVGHLFEWGARSPGSPGEGVGLAAAHALARNMGGQLRLAADSTPGATFVLELPSVRAQELQDVEL
jgi:signal transduction histidine kinase